MRVKIVIFRYFTRSLILITIALNCGCIAVHFRNAARQSIEYKIVTKRLKEERLRGVKQHPDERPPLRDAELGTDEARLEGVFVGNSDAVRKASHVLIGAQNRNIIEFTEREQVPYKVEAETIFDSALLLSRAPRTCIALTLQSETLYMRDFSQMEILFEVDREPVEFELEVEPLVQSEIWYRQRYYWVFLYESLFDYVIQRATLCAPVEAREVVFLDLQNDLYSTRDDDPWHLSFRWFVAGH